MWPMLQDSPVLSFSGTGTTCLSLVSVLSMIFCLGGTLEIFEFYIARDAI